MAYLELNGIWKKYPSHSLFEDLQFQVEEGEFLVLLGPSGCGKSTILRLIAGLETLEKGRIFLQGRDIVTLSPAKRNIAMVFQNYALYPHMTVRKNLCFPLKMAKIPLKEQEVRVQEVAQILELTPLLERKPGQLSGGQMQRVAVGRALIRKPSLFLLDEPLSNLDAKLRQQLRLEFKNLHQKLGITTLYVTHDQTEAMTLGHRVLLLNQGKIQQLGKPLELYHQPMNTFVAGFLGSPPINLISQDVLKQTFSLPEKGVLGVRPEHLRKAEVGESVLFEGKVLWIESLGAETLVTFAVGSSKVVMKVIQGEVPDVGETVSLTALMEQIRGFDGEGKKIF